MPQHRADTAAGNLALVEGLLHKAPEVLQAMAGMLPELRAEAERLEKEDTR